MSSGLSSKLKTSRLAFWRSGLLDLGRQMKPLLQAPPDQDLCIGAAQPPGHRCHRPVLHDFPLALAQWGVCLHSCCSYEHR